jgi:hypothetical protein
MSEGSDISTLYREFADALTEVLAENPIGPLGNHSNVTDFCSAKAQS